MFLILGPGISSSSSRLIAASPPIPWTGLRTMALKRSFAEVTKQRQQRKEPWHSSWCCTDYVRFAGFRSVDPSRQEVGKTKLYIVCSQQRRSAEDGSVFMRSDFEKLREEAVTYDETREKIIKRSRGQFSCRQMPEEIH